MKTFLTSRKIAAPPEVVFDAIRNPERLARWWGPDRFTNTFEVFQFRDGGHWKFTMHGPDGKNYSNECRFVSVEPPSSVTIRHISLPQFELSIQLDAVPGGTLLTWRQTLEDPAVANAMRNIIGPANEENLDRLELELASAAKAHASNG